MTKLISNRTLFQIPRKITKAKLWLLWCRKNNLVDPHPDDPTWKENCRHSQWVWWVKQHTARRSNTRPLALFQLLSVTNSRVRLTSRDSKPSTHKIWVGSVVFTLAILVKFVRKYKWEIISLLIAGSESADEKSMAVTEEGETYSEWLELR